MTLNPLIQLQSSFSRFGFLVAIGLLLAGCVSPIVPGAPTETKIPVGIPCITADRVPARPDFVTDGQLAAKPDDQLVISLASDRLSRMEYEGRLEAVIVGCVGSAPLPMAAPVDKPDAARPWWKIW